MIFSKKFEGALVKFPRIVNCMKWQTISRNFRFLLLKDNNEMLIPEKE